MFKWLFGSYLEKRRIRKQKEAEEIKKEGQEKLKEAIARHEADKAKIEKRIEKMCKTQCIFVGNASTDTCFQECIHFDRGWIDKPRIYYSTVISPVWVVNMERTKMPRCKLWRGEDN